MSDPDPTKTTPPRHPILRALWRIPLLAAATIYFLIDDVVLAAVRPLVAWAAELRLFVRIAAALDRLPPYPTLALFLVPFAVLEPVKLWALWLLATGRVMPGAVALVIAHLLSIVLVERLFHATRAKLLTIGWFAWAYRLVMRLYDWSVGRLRTTPTWIAVVSALGALRRRIGSTLQALRPGFRALRESLAGLARRLRAARGR